MDRTEDPSNTTIWRRGYQSQRPRQAPSPAKAAATWLVMTCLDATSYSDPERQNAIAFRFHAAIRLTQPGPAEISFAKFVTKRFCPAFDENEPGSGPLSICDDCGGLPRRLRFPISGECGTASSGPFASRAVSEDLCKSSSAPAGRRWERPIQPTGSDSTALWLRRTIFSLRGQRLETA